MTRIAFYDPDVHTSYVSGSFDIEPNDASSHFNGTSSLLDFMSRLSDLERICPCDDDIPGTRLTVLHDLPPTDSNTVIIRKTKIPG